MHIKPLAFSLCAALLSTACNQPPPDTHPQQLVTKRQALFKDFTRTLEPMGLVARERQPYDAAQFKRQALALQALSTRPWAYFTPDGNYPPTRARAEVWQQPAEFDAAQRAFVASVRQLVAAAQAGEQGGDRAGIASAVGAVEARCKDCHDRFRQVRR